MNTSQAMSHRSKRILISLGLVCLVLLTLMVGWGAAKGPKPSVAAATASATTTTNRANTPTSPNSSSRNAGTLVTDEQSPSEAIATFRKRLALVIAQPKLTDDQRKSEVMALLTALRESLAKAAPDAAAKAIQQVLNSGQDSPTGLGFTLAPGGALQEAPSLRAALLDLLARVDPAASIEQARKVFAHSESPDEWALALRNLGWQNTQGEHTTELRDRFNQMINNDAWLAQPTQGMLEAFDTAVHLGGPQELSQIVSLVKPMDATGKPVENGITHAAFLALDRLTVNNPEQTFTALLNDSQMLSWSPAHRAGVLARADISQPTQRQQLERYLSTLKPGSEELKTFTRLFPNHNGSLGNNLITTAPAAPKREHLIRKDQASLMALKSWIDVNRFPPITGELKNTHSRLKQMLVGQE